MLKNIYFVVKKSKSVAIDRERIDSFVKKINPKEIVYQKNAVFSNWPNDNHRLNFIFLFSLINFSFWTIKSYNGTEIFIQLLKKICLENFKNGSRNFIKKSIDYLFRLEKKINDPCLIFRLQSLTEANKILSKKYQNSVFYLIKKAYFDAEKLVKILAEDFSSFNDHAFYQGKKVEFFKKAQIFVTLVYVYCRSFKIKNIDKITAGADYRLPCFLQHLRILRYTKKLNLLIKKGQIIPALSMEEVEIRANTIHVIEIIKKTLEDFYKKKFFSYIIDNYLWLKGRKIRKIAKSHHRTITIYY